MRTLQHACFLQYFFFMYNLNINICENFTMFFYFLGHSLLLLQLLAGREKIRVLKADTKKGETRVLG